MSQLSPGQIRIIEENYRKVTDQQLPPVLITKSDCTVQQADKKVVFNNQQLDELTKFIFQQLRLNFDEKTARSKLVEVMTGIIKDSKNPIESFCRRVDTPRSEPEYGLGDLEIKSNFDEQDNLLIEDCLYQLTELVSKAGADDLSVLSNRIDQLQTAVKERQEMFNTKRQLQQQLEEVRNKRREEEQGIIERMKQIDGKIFKP